MCVGQDDATFSDCHDGAVAMVATDAIKLPDYGFLHNHEYSSHLYTTDAASSWSGHQFSGLKLTCWFVRHWQQATYNIVLAQFLTTALVATVWSIDRDNVGERLGADFTLILAGVAMKFVVSADLPPVSYVTLIEVYINFTYLFLTIGTVFHAAASPYSLYNLDQAQQVVVGQDGSSSSAGPQASGTEQAGSWLDVSLLGMSCGEDKTRCDLWYYSAWVNAWTCVRVHVANCERTVARACPALLFAAAAFMLLTSHLVASTDCST
jgi:hypothetical protein